MRIEYDRDADAAYIYVKDQIEDSESKLQVPVESDGVAGMVVLDFDGEGRLLGIEVVGAQRALPTGVLDTASEL